MIKKKSYLHIVIQSAGNTSADEAAGVDYALKPFDGNKNKDKQQVDVGGSDAGGGATGEDFGLKLHIRGRVMSISDYIVST